MKPVTHALLGSAAAASLTPVLGRDALVFGLASVAIDVDHYLEFLYYNRFRDWSVRGMLAFHAEIWNRRYRADLMGLSIFHTAESLVVLAVGATISGSAANDSRHNYRGRYISTVCLLATSDLASRPRSATSESV